LIFDNGEALGIRCEPMRRRDFLSAFRHVAWGCGWFVVFFSGAIGLIVFRPSSGRGGLSFGEGERDLIAGLLFISAGCLVRGGFCRNVVQRLFEIGFVCRGYFLVVIRAALFGIIIVPAAAAAP